MVTTTTMSWGKPTSSGFTILIPTGTTKIDPKTAVVLNWGGGGGSSTPTPAPSIAAVVAASQAPVVIVSDADKAYTEAQNVKLKQEAQAIASYNLWQGITGNQPPMQSIDPKSLDKYSHTKPSVWFRKRFCIRKCKPTSWRNAIVLFSSSTKYF